MSGTEPKQPKLLKSTNQQKLNVPNHEEMDHITNPLLTRASLVAGGKESACNARDPASIPGLGISPGEGNSNPIQYSCLENSTERGAWWATVYGITKSRT